MKKVIALLIVLSVLLTGCKNNEKKDTNVTSNNGTKNSNVTKEDTDRQVQENQKEEVKTTQKPSKEDNAKEANSEDENAGPSSPEKKTDEEIESTINTDSELNFEYSRKPPVARWDMLTKKLSTLSEAKSGSYYELRQADLSSVDLSNAIDELKEFWFDSNTIWPEKLPEGFDPKALLELGKNPGLGIRILQKEGITGKGVNIAIIDQPLLLEHDEYRSQLRRYDETGLGTQFPSASMHGPFVASIAVGKTCGVAPEAGLYFIGSTNYDFVKQEMDFSFYAEAIDEIIEINQELPKEQKIRAISISASWTPEHKGYKEFTDAIKRAEKENIFVISCNLFETYGFWYYGVVKDPYSDPDDSKSYSLFDWKSWTKMVNHIPGFVPYYEKSLNEKFDGKMLVLPFPPRTCAAATGKDIYAYITLGGWSLLEPYLAGLYAMACQVNPDVTPEEFWNAALESGDAMQVSNGSKEFPASMINPVKLINSLK